MSAREFRQRYGRLTDYADSSPVRRQFADSSHLPAGANISHTSSGEVITFTEKFNDTSARESQLLLDTIPQIQNNDLVFLDTETTGLAGGTGTFAFLVGLGRFVGDEFNITQYFLRSPADERAMLTALNFEFQQTDVVVSYNGRSFDVPLLESRFRLMHRSMPLAFDHLDLLFPCRAIWKHRLANCALSNIERNILGVEREIDAPGWLIPSIYFDYLRSKRPEPLTPVLEHNRVDIFSLARLTALVLAYESNILEPVDSTDRMSLQLHRMKKHGIGSHLNGNHELWNDRRAPAVLRRQLLQELSNHHKRQKNYQAVILEWEKGTHDPSRAIREYCAVELAKYHEHREKDLDCALFHAEAALNTALIGRDENSAREHLHRVNRLNRKLGKQEAG